MANKILRVNVFEDQPAALWRRVVALDGTGANMLTVTGEDGKLVKIADVSAASFSAYDLGTSTPGTPISGPTALVVATVFFDTLQSWAIDSTGYNFRYAVPAAVWANLGLHTVRAVVTVTLTGGTSFQLGWDCYVEQVKP